MMRQIIRVSVWVAPWLMAVALPIFPFPGFVDSNIGCLLLLVFDVVIALALLKEFI